ncbi:MAG: flagellar export chaperone FlgN [Aromatoleum sp.]|jgi:flagella synthesis protein FlgN|uniref:flagellar export chaperone FlgN n=1 Tax=Aromatoleum sp. TaxID=2307007 RepID=UPI002895763D|nr:flagellar export chaperone FlgN [Aromatoleum sp.]MDT3671904.1 flagellar export chaperone FlgN [Aromatoleum sp.]
MTRKDALDAILAGLVADVVDYRALRELLDAQFEAALHHDSARIADVGERITALASRMHARRAERVGLATRLVGRPAETPDPVFALMAGPARARAESSWRELERHVSECKALNERNCRLLMEQHEIMRRVLDSEVGTYAPA